MKKLILIIFALAMTLAVFADAYTIGTGTSTQSYIPFYGLYDYGWSKTIYTAAEMVAAGMPAAGTAITGISYYVGNTPVNYVSVDQRVYVRNTPATAIDLNYIADPLAEALPFTQVVGANLTWNGSGWHNILFNAPFPWNGTDNIEIYWQNWDGAYASGPTFRYTTTATYLACYRYADGSMPTTAATSTYSRPNIRFLDALVSPPGSPSLLLPVDLATGVSQSPTFSWSAPTTGGIPSSYKLYLSANTPTFTTPVYEGPNTSYPYSGVLSYNTPYYWKVAASNSAGDAESLVWSFTTMLDPTVTPDYCVDFGTLTTDWPVPNWTQLNYVIGGTPATGGSWYQDDWLNVTTPLNKAAKINIYYTHNSWLVTPPVAIPAGTYEVKFDLAFMVWNSLSTAVTPGNQADDRLLLVMADNPNMNTNPVILREWNNTTSPYVLDNVAPVGETHTIPLTGVVGTKYFAFYAESLVDGNGDNDLMIDNFCVRTPPTTAIFNLSPDVASWDFGTLPINTSGTKTFIVSNTGGAPLTFSSIGVTGTGFSPDPAFDTTPIPANGNRSFTVKFSPTAEQAYTGALEFNFSRETRTVALSGNGIDTSITYPDLPYATSFDDAWTGAPAVPLPGWTVVNANADSYTWRRGATYIPAHTGSYFAQGMGNTNDWLISPPINTGASVRLKWWDRVESVSYPNSYKVLYSTTDNQPASFVNELADITCNWLTWTEHTLSVNNTSGVLYLAFYQYASGSSSWDFGIDDFLLEELPSGPPTAPTLTYPLALNNLPQSGFNLTWAPDPLSGPVDWYTVYFWTDDQTIGEGPSWSTTATSLNPTAPPLDPLGNPQTPIGFNYLDRYNWTVEAYSASYPEAMAWPTESWFEIQDDPTIYDFCYTQDFETWPPLDWDLTGGTYSFAQYTAGTGNNWAYANFWGQTSGNTDIMTTPPIFSTTPLTLSFLWSHLYHTSYPNDALTVEVSTDHDNWVPIWYKGTTDLNSGDGATSTTPGTGAQASVFLPSELANTTFWLRFYGYSGYGPNLYIDDVTLCEAQDYDIGPTVITGVPQVVNDQAVIAPVVTVTNFGLMTATNWSLEIDWGTHHSSILNGPTILSGGSVDVTIPPFAAAAFTFDELTATTVWALDENAANNVKATPLTALPLNVAAVANDVWNDVYISFNLQTPNVQAALPIAPTYTLFMAGADWAENQWMGCEYWDSVTPDGDDTYNSINAITGETTYIGDMGYEIMGIAYDDDSNTMYGTDGNNLYTLNSLGAATLVGAHNNIIDGVTGLVIDIAYDNTHNILYAIDLSLDCLWTVNVSNGAVTFVGYLGININYAQDAAFDQENGLLYLAGYTTAPGLYWIDTAGGGAYLVGPMTSETTAFAIPYGSTAAAPDIEIDQTGTVSWTAVPNAVAYNIYAADDPYGEYTWVATTPYTSWLDPNFSEPMKFYYVKSVGGRNAGSASQVWNYNTELRKPKPGSFEPAQTGIAPRIPVK